MNKEQQFIKTQFSILRERLKTYDEAEFNSTTRRYFDNALDRLDESRMWAEKGICTSKQFNVNS